MKNKLVIALGGRLGNMLFKLSCGYEYAKQHDEDDNSVPVESNDNENQSNSDSDEENGNNNSRKTCH